MSTDVIVDKAWVEELVEVGKYCLLGKLLLHKGFNVEAMKTVFQKIWKLTSGFHIKEVGDGIFVFLFNDRMDKERVNQRQPWSFNKSLLVLQEYDGLAKLEEVVMDWCPF